MFDHAGQPMSEATLSEAAQIIGWRELPNAGDEILEVESEHRANVVMRFRHNKSLEKKMIEDAEVVEKKQSKHQAVRTVYLARTPSN